MAAILKFAFPPTVRQRRNGMKTIILIGVSLICCLGCKKEQSSQPAPQTPYEKWQSQNFHNYTIDQNRSCYCLQSGQLVRITVRSDTIAQVIRVSDASGITFPYCLTVDSLFGIVRNAKTDSLVIRYNTQYGYPEYLDVNPQLHPVDGGVLYETSNLQVP
jgi:hypothetical protein